MQLNESLEFHCHGIRSALMSQSLDWIGIERKVRCVRARDCQRQWKTAAVATSSATSWPSSGADLLHRFRVFCAPHWAPWVVAFCSSTSGQPVIISLSCINKRVKEVERTRDPALRIQSAAAKPTPIGSRRWRDVYRVDFHSLFFYELHFLCFSHRRPYCRIIFQFLFNHCCALLAVNLQSDLCYCYTLISIYAMKLKSELRVCPTRCSSAFEPLPTPQFIGLFQINNSIALNIMNV